MDDGIVPDSFTNGKKKRSADKFKSENWTRDQWKFDYHRLVEIDKKFLLSKKRVNLKAERFQFMKYGDTLLPFGNISLTDCDGGYWEYWERDCGIKISTYYKELTGVKVIRQSSTITFKAYQVMVQ